MRVAIFADIHGKILLPFKLVDLYQNETGNQIDAILQCGDIGAFPDPENLDKATIKHAKYDRDELGFYDDFVYENESIKKFLDELNINMICVCGNHEDHDFWDKLEEEHSEGSLFPIDIYKRVFVCKSGHKHKLQTKNEELTYIGIGRTGDRKGRSQKGLSRIMKERKLKSCFKPGSCLMFLSRTIKTIPTSVVMGCRKSERYWTTYSFTTIFTDIQESHLNKKQIATE